jgi:hypothetical protein
MARNHFKAGDIGPEVLVSTLPRSRYVFDNFGIDPSCSIAGANAAPSGSTLVQNKVFTGRNLFLYNQIVDQTDELYPTLSLTDGGYNIVLGTAETEGVEWNFGGLSALSPRNFIGSSEDFFGRIVVSFLDVSGIDFVFGVKKAAAGVASLTENTDQFVVRLLGDSSSTNAALTIVTQQNSEGTTDYTSTTSSITVGDLEGVEIEVRGKGGKAYAFVNGAQVTGHAAYTFDSGDALSFFLRAVQTTDTCASVRLLGYEQGLLTDRVADTLKSRLQATA